AARAARLAIAALARHAHESPPSLFERTHAALPISRGVVMSLAFFKRTDPSLTWLGVGNVEGLLVHAIDAARAARARKSLVTRGGIVGSELPRLQPEVLRLTPGDTLIFATEDRKSTR